MKQDEVMLRKQGEIGGAGGMRRECSAVEIATCA
jgi:hypothetical protein